MELYADKKMSLDYDVLEDSQTEELANQAHVAVFQGRGIQDSIMVFMLFSINVIGILFYGFFLAKINIILIVIVILSEMTVFMLLIYARKKEEAKWSEMSCAVRKMEYLTSNAGNIDAGKDVRVFGLHKWLLRKYDKALFDMGKLSLSTQNGYFLSSIVEVTLTFIKNCIMYVLLLSHLYEGKMGVS